MPRGRPCKQADQQSCKRRSLSQPRPWKVPRLPVLWKSRRFAGLSHRTLETAVGALPTAAWRTLRVHHTSHSLYDDELTQTTKNRAATGQYGWR